MKPRVAGGTPDLAQPREEVVSLWNAAALDADALARKEAACRRALAETPGAVEPRIDLAGCLIGKGELGSARSLLEAVLDQEPDHPGARRAWATLQAMLAQARTTLEATLRRQPDHAEARDLLCKVSFLQGDWASLRACWERELPRYSGPIRLYEEAHLHLLFGEFAEGWKLYEHRFADPDHRPLRTFAEPRWDGEPFPGKSLLLHWEQGFGDTVMFLRYAARAKALGGQVLATVQRELADLAGTCPGVDRVIPDGDPLPPFDLQLPLLSFPRVMGTGLDSIPRDIPYLDIPGRVPNRGAIAQALAPSRGRTRVGLVWSGNPKHKHDSGRSIPARALAPLGALGGVAWHSFQVGGGETPSLPGLVELGALFTSFSDTAYALSGMALVISVDTAVAHLSAALGVPTLLLLPFQPDFRWLIGRDDSPWYPSMKLYRQTNPGDWDGVVRRLARDLR